MREIEESYYDLYKHVDNICRDMFLGDHYYNNKGEEIYGVSAYIKAMETESAAARFGVPDWDGQLRQLKELRHIRNRITHDNADSGCTEAHLNALEAFYRQLLSQQDPLALAHRMQRQRAAQPPRQTPERLTAAQSPQPQQKERRRFRAHFVWAAALLLLILAAAVYYLYSH